MSGSVLDVVLDLRRGLNYSHVACAQLSAHDGNMIFIPKGVAHGFLASVDASTLVYKTSTIHQPQYDDGIAWNSFDFNWGLVDEPIISMRDESHPSLAKFDTPF
jgi:dTDP-4-dehydrorhamnose 3,5-epimerase/CDP-3, 6-dideoxy-D-glycero-D-glycero-4-hexulose-5-epimerase